MKRAQTDTALIVLIQQMPSHPTWCCLTTAPLAAGAGAAAARQSAMQYLMACYCPRPLPNWRMEHQMQMRTAYQLIYMQSKTLTCPRLTLLTAHCRVERLGVRHLEAVFGGLISVMAISFGVMYFIAGVPTSEVIEGSRLHHKIWLAQCSHVSQDRR